MKGSGFDWYELSKMNEDNPDIKKFSQIIKPTNLNLSSVPPSYRKKLLILFQRASFFLKEQCEKETQSMSQLQFQKQVLGNQVTSMETSLESSLQEIQSLKVQINDKKKQTEKLKQKIAMKKKAAPKQIFFCPFCQKQDFQNRDAFTCHMFKEHKQSHENENKSNRNESENFKEMIMTLKDKEIQLMSMMLNQKKQMESQELEKAYQIELMKMTHSKPNIIQQGINAKSAYEGSYDDELKGESQHLFYKEKNQYEEEQYQERLARRREEQSTAFKQAYIQERERYENQMYYDIFPGISQMKKPQARVQTNPHMERSQPVEISNKKQTMPNKSYPSKALNWDHSIRKPSEYYLGDSQVQKHQMAKNNQKRLSSHHTLSNVYQSSRQIEAAYVFNCGPLMDDPGDGSDYEDYFQNDRNQQIEDEEIKIDDKEYHESENVKNISGIRSQNMILELSKERSSLELSKDESSFSKREFQLSKDDSSINLSDLRFSKLQRKKEIEKKMGRNNNEQLLNEFLMKEERQRGLGDEIEMPSYSMKKEDKRKMSVLDEFMRESSDSASRQ